MKIFVAVISAIVISASPADAKGFLSALLHSGAHVAVHAGIHAGVHAAQAAAHGGAHTSPAVKTYSIDTLTVDQIEKCIRLAQDLDRSSEKVENLSNAISAEKAAITDAQQALSEEKDLVDRYSKTRVTAYNKKLDAMNMRISAYNANVERGQAEGAAHNVRVSSYNAECAKKYYADDMAVVRVKLGLQEDPK